MFRHHFIARELPADHGWGFGTPMLADIDNDGDLDFAVSNRNDAIYWFEFSPSGWKRHVLGAITNGQLGSVSLDVDGDAHVDLVVGGYWYRNPGNPREARFERIAYDPAIRGEIHDMVAADVDADGRPDVVATGDEDGCFWYRIPRDPLADRVWERHVITLDVLDSNDHIHSGFVPGGVGDLDGDGDADIVLPDRWMENTGSGLAWKHHALPFGSRGPWGLSSRSWIADIDSDGDADIVMADSDQQNSGIAVLTSNGARPPVFETSFLPNRAPGTRGSFHSLRLADFDGDGDLDILTADQEDPSILPAGATPRFYVFENTGNVQERFLERVVFDGRLGGHDILVGDVDGDGDLDFVSKIWNRWPGNANGGKFHADYFENLRKRPGGGK